MTWAFIATWIIIQILLMIRFRIPPLSCLQNFCDYTPFPPFLIDLLSNFPRFFFLFFIVVKDSRSILSASVWTLLI
nr:methioninesulfoxide reductase [Botrytis cinerea]